MKRKKKNCHLGTAKQSGYNSFFFRGKDLHFTIDQLSDINIGCKQSGYICNWVFIVCFLFFLLLLSLLLSLLLFVGGGCGISNRYPLILFTDPICSTIFFLLDWGGFRTVTGARRKSVFAGNVIRNLPEVPNPDSNSPTSHPPLYVLDADKDERLAPTSFHLFAQYGYNWIFLIPSPWIIETHDRPGLTDSYLYLQLHEHYLPNLR